MNQQGIELRKSLRTEAEAMVGSLSPAETVARPAEVLMHELLVHKVELEMQNEELRRAYAELEEARDRYADLYEFAPIGYITLNRDGVIVEINLAGSILLGVDRSHLAHRRFSEFVAPQDRDHWHRLFLGGMEHANAERQAFGLEMTGACGAMFYAHLNCLRREGVDSDPVLWVALADVSKI